MSGFSTTKSNIDAAATIPKAPGHEQPLRDASSTPEAPYALDSYRILGKTGLRVSPLALGCMSFGSKWGWANTAPKEEQEAIFAAYVEAGGNFIDTANNYHYGESEEFLGEWIEKRGIRDSLVIASKFSSADRKGDPNSRGNGAKSLITSLNNTLKRLRTTYLDILYVHFWDYSTSEEQLMSSLNTVVQQGKVLHLGISDAPAWVVARCNTIAEMRGWTPFSCYQGKWSLADRTMEREIVPCCQSLNVGIIPWGVLGQGKLTGKYTRDGSHHDAHRHSMVAMSEKDYDVSEAVVAIAKEIKREPIEVALSWMLGQPTVPSILIGCRSLKQLQGCIAGLNFSLSDEIRARLDGPSAVEPGFPQDFIGTSVASCPWLRDSLAFNVH